MPGLSLKTFSALFLMTFFATQQLLAQVTDDFSDGNFTTNPAWNGSTDDFIVNGLFQLQLNNTVAGGSYLSATFNSSSLDDLQWEFFVKQSFSPSGGNFGRVYLVSDQPDLTSSLNGYYLQFGEAGSNDAVELFRQTGANSISVCRGTVAGIATSFGIRVKVIRNHSGLWQLYIDYSGGTDFVLEASGTEISHNTTAYFGIFCNYTISNAAGFYYDDFSIHHITLPDTAAPEIVSLEAASSHELQIVFSEKLDPNTVRNPLNYYARSLGNPSSVTLQDDEKTLILTFSLPFENGNTYDITVRDVTDLAGNRIEPTDKNFLYFEPVHARFKDVIITEFCADPTPVVGLPEAEFVEIFNRGNNPFDLSDWTLGDLTGFGKLPSFILLPGYYLILTSANASAQFNAFGTVLAVSPFRTLNNAGDAIVLKNAEGKTIDSLQYSLSWYQDKEKADGGWSMEIIDPENVCAASGNWAVAASETGGTPGEQNAVYANKPDNTGPKLLAIIPDDPATLSLIFDEKLEDIVPSAANFTLDPPLEIEEVAFADPSLSTIRLTLLQEIQASKHYHLTVKDVYDCAGNKIQDGFSQAQFILPEQASAGDIVINEILFNPRPTGVDFVEIYNRSGKTIDLQDWLIGNFNDEVITDGKKVSNGSLIIRPNEYMVLTEDANVLKGEYLTGIEKAFIEIDLPAFNDDAGSVAIVDQQGIVMDHFHYNDEMHAVFLKDVDGVSLERISFEGQSNDAQNWRSASADRGFATPGYLNSNFRKEGLPDDGSVIVEPEIFQPHVGSGNFTQIKYRFDRGGFVANIKVFDQQGRAIKQLAHNELLGTDGFFRWDGDQDNGTRARMGYYMVWFEVFNADGILKTFKRRVAIY